MQDRKSPKELCIKCKTVKSFASNARQSRVLYQMQGSQERRRTLACKTVKDAVEFSRARQSRASSIEDIRSHAKKKDDSDDDDSEEEPAPKKSRATGSNSAKKQLGGRKKL